MKQLIMVLLLALFFPLFHSHADVIFTPQERVAFALHIPPSIIYLASGLIFLFIFLGIIYLIYLGINAVVKKIKSNVQKSQIQTPKK
ncbi:MAG: hypothetical protein WCK11_00815 [Candidatus Falkowbacteria bacterium]